MACTRYCKLFQRHNVLQSRLHSIGIRNTWIIVKNNTGHKMMADICPPDKQTNSQGMIHVNICILCICIYIYIYIYIYCMI